jgi:hypothetical protein
MPLKPTVLLTTASQNGHRLFSTRSWIPASAWQRSRSHRFGRAEWLDRLERDVGVWLGCAEALETIGRHPIGEQARRPHRFQPAVLDRVNPLAAAGTNDAITVHIRGCIAHPRHGSRALTWEPVVGGSVVVDCPHICLRLLGRCGDVRHEQRDRWILREVQHLAGLWSHFLMNTRRPYGAQLSFHYERSKGLPPERIKSRSGLR